MRDVKVSVASSLKPYAPGLSPHCRLLWISQQPGCYQMKTGRNQGGFCQVWLTNENIRHCRAFAPYRG
ncbi:hypothetical protein C8J33_101737 [Rhizobium sp. PP-CC-3G-465]|nr:hypothetical protein C8J33_101737 [Rhizobium sp. PP-CC-3G-465]